MPEDATNTPNTTEASLPVDEGKKVERHIRDRVLPRWMKLNDGRIIHIKVFDDITAASAGDGKFIVMMTPHYNGLMLASCYAYVTGASSSGALTIQIRNITQTVDMLTTAITIDQSELSSLTAATAAVIDRSNADVATGDQIAIDVDGAGTSAEGLGVVLTFA